MKTRKNRKILGGGGDDDVDKPDGTKIRTIDRSPLGRSPLVITDKTNKRPGIKVSPSESQLTPSLTPSSESQSTPSLTSQLTSPLPPPSLTSQLTSSLPPSSESQLTPPLPPSSESESQSPPPPPPPPSIVKTGKLNMGAFGSLFGNNPATPSPDSDNPPAPINIWPVEDGFNKNYMEIYNKLYTKQRSNAASPTFQLSKIIKNEIKANFPQFSEEEVNSAASEINTQLTISLKKAPEAEANAITLDPEIIKSLQDLYDSLQNANQPGVGMSETDIGILKDRIKSNVIKKINDNYKITNPFLKERYFKELKVIKEINFKEPKFEKLFTILNCNADCLKTEIQKLALGMDATSKLNIIELEKLIKKNEEDKKNEKDEEKIKAFEEYIQNLKKEIEKEKQITFTQKEIDKFDSAYNEGSIASKFFPHIKSKCGKKTSTSNNPTADSASLNLQSDNSKSPCDKYLDMDSTKYDKVSYNDMYDLLKCLIFNIKKEEDTVKVTELTRKKESLLAIMPQQFKNEKIKELKTLVDRINEKGEKTTNQLLQQKGANKQIQDIKDALKNGEYENALQSANKEAEQMFTEHKRKIEAQNKIDEEKAIKKKKDEEKQTYITKFKEEYPESGEKYLTQLNIIKTRNPSLKDFKNKFPNENQEEFWEKVVGMTLEKWQSQQSKLQNPIEKSRDLNRPGATKVQTSNDPESQSPHVKSTSKKDYNIQLGSIPSEDEIDFNKILHNFALNAEGQFIKDDKIVNIFGDEIAKSKGGNRKSKKRGGRRVSIKKTRIKQKCRDSTKKIIKILSRHTQ